MTRPAAERRKAPRAKAEFQIRLGERAATKEARIQDLSTSGLCCHFGDAIREMTLVEIGMQLPGDDTLHALRGAVVRCQKLRGQNPPTYEIAVFFTELPPACRQAIGEFVTARVDA